LSGKPLLRLLVFRLLRLLRFFVDIEFEL
jgi:hypothetical protein